MGHHTHNTEMSWLRRGESSQSALIAIRPSENGGPSSPAAEPHEVVALVRGARGRPDLRRALALHLQSAGLAAGRGQPAELTVLHHGLADPIDAGVVADHLVVRVDH